MILWADSLGWPLLALHRSFTELGSWRCKTVPGGLPPVPGSCDRLLAGPPSPLYRGLLGVSGQGLEKETCSLFSTTSTGPRRPRVQPRCEGQGDSPHCLMGQLWSHDYKGSCAWRCKSCAHLLKPRDTPWGNLSVTKPLVSDGTFLRL